MTNESVEKYKIELSRSQIREIQHLIFKKISFGCDSVEEARDFIEIYDKLEKTLERNCSK